MKNTILAILAAAALSTTVAVTAHASRAGTIDDLDGLQALDDGHGCDLGICSAFAAVNAHLPENDRAARVALRAENTVAKAYLLVQDAPTASSAVAMR